MAQRDKCPFISVIYVCIYLKIPKWKKHDSGVFFSPFFLSLPRKNNHLSEKNGRWVYIVPSHPAPSHSRMNLKKSLIVLMPREVCCVLWSFILISYVFAWFSWVSALLHSFVFEVCISNLYYKPCSHFLYPYDVKDRNRFTAQHGTSCCHSNYMFKVRLKTNKGTI